MSFQSERNRTDPLNEPHPFNPPALIALSITGRPQDSAKPPNVLVIVIDDLSDWVGCLGGHPQARTPHIDRLASRSPYSSFDSPKDHPPFPMQFKLNAPFGGRKIFHQEIGNKTEKDC